MKTSQLRQLGDSTTRAVSKRRTGGRQSLEVLERRQLRRNSVRRDKQEG